MKDTRPRDVRLRDIRGALGKKNKNPLDDWCDKPNLAIYLGLDDEETLTNWQKKEGLPFATVGRITFFSLSEIDKWLRARLVTLFSEGQGQKEVQKKEGTTKEAGVDEIRTN